MSDWGGQGIFVGGRGGGEDMRAFWAKVAGREDAEGSGG